MDKVKQLGQYFTPAFVADFMVGLSSMPKTARVLEPSSGQGVFLDSLHQAGFKNCTGLEIDATLINRHDNRVSNQSFVSASFDRPFDLIIGNPPYVRWKNMAQAQKDELAVSRLWKRYFNSLSDYLYIFILKSVELLNDGGELIFITPEYWLGTLHSQALRDYLLDHGQVEEIYHFSETPIFDKVTSSIIIFKFVKGSHNDKLKVHRYASRQRLQPNNLKNINQSNNWSNFETTQFTKNSSWILAPDNITSELLRYEQHCTVRLDDVRELSLLPDAEMAYVTLGDIATIANGLVSGLDKAFQIDQHQLNNNEQRASLDVIKARHIASLRSTGDQKYIFLNETVIDEPTLQNDYPNFYKQLIPFKSALLQRYSYNRDIPYWDWVFLRSMALFKQPRPKLFVPCKERITNKDHLRFCLASPKQYPTQDVTAIYLHTALQESPYYILGLLNSKVVFDWVRCKGLVKGGIAEFSERPLSSIPIRLIDWSNKQDVALHTKIDQAARRGDIAEVDRSVAALLR